MLFHAFIYPRYEIRGAVSGALCLDMLLAPYGSKINGFHSVIILKRKSKVDFCRKRSIALCDAGADSPMFCGRAGTISVLGFQQII